MKKREINFLGFIITRQKKGAYTIGADQFIFKTLRNTKDFIINYAIKMPVKDLNKAKFTK